MQGIDEGGQHLLLAGGEGLPPLPVLGEAAEPDEEPVNLDRRVGGKGEGGGTSSTAEMKLKPRQAPMSPPAWARKPTQERETTLEQEESDGTKT